AEREAAEEDQAVGIVVLPQPPGGPLAPGLLDDRQEIALDLHVAEERLEALICPGLRRCLAQLDQPAIVAAGRRRRTRQRRLGFQRVAFLADLGREALARFG